jgi:trehalose 6-phosphate synthase/phosphatase
VDRVLEARSDREMSTVSYRGQMTEVKRYPISVEYPPPAQLMARTVDECRAAVRERHGLPADQMIGIGVDRLDYTKGIEERMRAVERLFELHPEWIGRFTFIQIAAPTRSRIDEYQHYEEQVRALGARINARFEGHGAPALILAIAHHEPQQVYEYYRAAELCFVSSLHDGMNLVAKEFVTSRTDEDGVLVLSEFAGAAAEMGEALQVNPYDVETMARVYGEALTMPEEERHLRMRALRQRIASRDVQNWAQSFIEALGGVRGGAEVAPKAALTSSDDLAELSNRMRSAERLVLLLDYDGTLVPFARAPDLATPDRGLRDLLSALAAKPSIRVHIVSGRSRETLERWLGKLPIGLHAEHGYWSRMDPGHPWMAMTDLPVGWKAETRRLLDQATATTPGALVEEKTASLAWHYRMAEPELGAARAEDLAFRLEELLRDLPVELLRGDKVLEIRPRGVHKGRILERILESYEPPPPLLAAMGDDQTDEDLFKAMPADGIAIGVGFRPTIARYRVATPAAARALLQSLAEPAS